MLFAWTQEEEEGAMEQEQKAFEIYNISEEFVPDINNLKVKYRINDISKIDGIEELRSVKSVQFLALKDDETNNNDVLYYMDNDILKDTENNTWDTEKYEGQFIWNGHYNTESDKKVSSKDGEIKLVVSCTADGKIIENIPGMTVLINGQEILYSSVHDGEFTLTDNVTFSIDPAVEEWFANEDMQGWVPKKWSEPSRLDAYKRVREIYMTYEGVQEAGDPFEYIKQNTETIEFLGKNLKAHKEFAIVLNKVKESLVAKGVYDALKSKYSNKPIGTLALREVNDKYGAGKISEHGFAMAIDIYYKKNPQIQTTRPYVRFLIEHSTGFDLGEPKTVTKIKNAHNKFISIFEGTSIDLLKKKYSDINNYNKEESSIKLDSLFVVEQMLNNIKSTYNSLDSNSTGSTINVINSNIESLSMQINSLKQHLENHKNAIVFDNTANAKIDVLLSRLSVIVHELSALKDNLRQNNYEDLVDFTTLSITDYSNVQNKINSFYQEQKKLV